MGGKAQQEYNTPTSFTGSFTTSCSMQRSSSDEGNQPGDDKNTSSIVAGWTISSIIQGTGLLGIPFAMQQSGWIGIAAIFVVAAIGAYTAKLIQECMYEPQSPDSCPKHKSMDGYGTNQDTGALICVRRNFPEIGEDAFGWWGRTFIEIVQTVEMFGATVLFIVLLGETAQDLLRSLPAMENLSFNVTTACACLVLVPLLVCARNMCVISMMSAVAGILCLLATMTLLVFCGLNESKWQIKGIPAIKPTFPIGFGIIVFSYCGHAAFPSIEQSMRKPWKFVTVSNVSFLLAAVVKTLLGVGMLFMYGDETAQVATNNLRGDIVPHHLATALVFGNAFLMLPLIMRVVGDVFDSKLLHRFPSVGLDSGRHWVWIAMTRPLLLAVGLVMSILVPHFGLVMGFVGNITGTTLSFIGPCLFHMKLRWHDLSWCSIMPSVLVVAFGLMCGSYGTVLSGKALIEAFGKPYHSPLIATTEPPQFSSSTD